MLSQTPLTDESIELTLVRRVADTAYASEMARRASQHLYAQILSWDEAQGILAKAEDEALWQYEKALGEYRKWIEINYDPRGEGPDRENKGSSKIDDEIILSDNSMDKGQNQTLDPNSVINSREGSLGSGKKTIRRKGSIKGKTTTDTK